MPTHSGNTLLLVTDQQNSVLSAVGETGVDAIPYTAYGHSQLDASQSRLRFNGGIQELMTGYYPLGQGYRMYSPLLMRFLSSDSFSPFVARAMNAYAYCDGDPVNRLDLSGHLWGIGKFFRSIFKKPIPATRATLVTPANMPAPNILGKISSDEFLARGFHTHAPKTAVKPSLPVGHHSSNLSVSSYSSSSSPPPPPAPRRAISKYKPNPPKKAVVPPAARPTQAPVAYTNPAAASNIQSKLDKLESSHTKNWQMDDYYNKKDKYRQQLANLEIRKS